MMIRRLILVLLCCGFVMMPFAQKFDYNWLTGYNAGGGPDTSEGHYYGFTHFDFNSNPVQITRQSLNMNFSASNSAKNERFSTPAKTLF